MIVVYEDNHIIVVNKTSSEIVQGDKTGDTPLSEMVKQYLKEKYNKPGNVFIGVTHRLDRPVSGLVVFAKTSKALPRLNEMFRNGEVKKTYWAIVKECPKETEGELVHYLVRNEKQNKSYAYDKEVKNSKKAVLHYKLIGHSQNYYLLEVDLKTGRHHQIRCQLAMKYGELCLRENEIAYADPGFFRLFDFELLKGDRASCLSMPGQVVITERIARKYFRDEGHREPLAQAEPEDLQALGQNAESRRAHHPHRQDHYAPAGCDLPQRTQLGVPLPVPDAGTAQRAEAVLRRPRHHAGRPHHL